MSENPEANTDDTVFSDPVDTVNTVDHVATEAASSSTDPVTYNYTAASSNTNASTSLTPFVFTNAFRYIGGRPVYGAVSSGFGRVSSLGAMHSDSVKGIDYADKTTTSASATGVTNTAASTRGVFGSRPSGVTERIRFARGLDTSATHRFTSNSVVDSVDNSARPRLNTTSLFRSSGPFGVTNVTWGCSCYME